MQLVDLVTGNIGVSHIYAQMKECKTGSIKCLLVDGWEHKALQLRPKVAFKNRNTAVKTVSLISQNVIAGKLEDNYNAIEKLDSYTRSI